MARRALGPASLRIVQAIRAGVDPTSVLVACSGGPDSLALAAATPFALGADVARAAAVVDHGLQPGSDAQAAGVVDQLRVLGYAHVHLLPVDVRARGQGPEASARAARYAALDELAVQTGAQILLGHTRDDQAETVLLGLLRGSGTRSLAGMAARSGRCRRPLLGLPRTDTEQACAEFGLQPWRDPHNEDPAFTRSRLRHRVLPQLETEVGPGVTEALARTADLARADADLLDRLAAELRTAASEGEGLRCEPLAGADDALRTRALRSWLLDRGAPEVSAGHVASVLALVTDWHGQGPIDVPGLRVHRTAGRLIASRPEGAEPAPAA